LLSLITVPPDRFGKLDRYGPDCLFRCLLRRSCQGRSMDLAGRRLAASRAQR
jgi:hypothetical protein